MIICMLGVRNYRGPKAVEKKNYKIQIRFPFAVILFWKVIVFDQRVTPVSRQLLAAAAAAQFYGMASGGGEYRGWRAGWGGRRRAYTARYRCRLALVVISW